MEKRKSNTQRHGRTGYAETRNLRPFGGSKSTAHVRTANFIPPTPGMERMETKAFAENLSFVLLAEVAQRFYGNSWVPSVEAQLPRDWK